MNLGSIRSISGNKVYLNKFFKIILCGPNGLTNGPLSELKRYHEVKVDMIPVVENEPWGYNMALIKKWFSSTKLTMHTKKIIACG